MVMEILDNKKNTLKSLNCNYDWNKKPLEPNGIVTEVLVFGINKYEDGEVINVMASNQWNPKYIDKKLVFSKGDSLRVF